MSVRGRPRVCGGRRPPLGRSGSALSPGPRGSAHCSCPEGRLARGSLLAEKTGLRRGFGGGRRRRGRGLLLEFAGRGVWCIAVKDMPTPTATPAVTTTAMAVTDTRAATDEAVLPCPPPLPHSPKPIFTRCQSASRYPLPFGPSSTSTAVSSPTNARRPSSVGLPFSSTSVVQDAVFGHAAVSPRRRRGVFERARCDRSAAGVKDTLESEGIFMWARLG
jgi:hypothetical protein